MLLLLEKRVPWSWYVPPRSAHLGTEFRFPHENTGSAFVRNDAKVFRFCTSKYAHKGHTVIQFHSFQPSDVIRTSSKSSLRGSVATPDACSVINRMKRNPRKVRWTKAFRKAAGKEMIIVRPTGRSKLSVLLKTLSLPVPVGLDHRFRKTKKRPSALQPRLGSNHHQGYETHSRDQEEKRTRILEEQVRLRRLFPGVCFGPDRITLQKDGRSQGEGQGPPTKTPRKQRIRLDETGGASRRLCLANTGENQSQVLVSQCTHPRRRPIHGYGNRLTICCLICILYNAVTHPGGLIHTHQLVHHRVLDYYCLKV